MADPFSAWGPQESGERTYERDSIFRRDEALKAQEMLGKIAMQPDQARLLRSHADLYEGQAKKFNREDEAARRMEAAVSGAELPDDPMERLYKLSSIAAGAGNLKVASEMVDKIGQLAQRSAAAVASQARAENQQVQSKIKTQDFIANRLSAAGSQQQFNDENNRYEQEFGEASPYKGMPWTPALSKQIGQSAISAKDRLTALLRENEEKGRASGRAIMDRHNRATEAIGEERNRIAETRATALNKVGAAGSPSLRETAATDALLTEHVPDLKGADKTRAATDIASRAKEIRGQNRAIGMAQANQMAFREFNEAGVFETEKNRFIPDKTKYSSGGMSQDTALPMPDKKDALKKSRYYMTPRGLARWNGAAFDPVADEEEDDE